MVVQIAPSGKPIVVSAGFSRPADTTPYIDGDLVANSTTAGLIVPLALPVGREGEGRVCGIIGKARLKKTGANIAARGFRAHFFQDSPTAASGDNAPFSTSASNYLGFSLFTQEFKTFTDGKVSLASDWSGRMMFDCPAGTENIYALLEVSDAYTPASGETFTLTIEAVRF
ncbi:hypothetical protein [uncultured Enterovirga sp.]|uniref:hypothetical protein n=1 Tax=uncultured Enterovirga sp. TaxID=2026352 RepID=UPI0035CBBA94